MKTDKSYSSKKRSSAKVSSDEMVFNTSILDVLLKNSFEVIALFSEDGVLRHVSSSIKEIAGFEAKELIGKNIFNFVHPDDQESIGLLFQNLNAFDNKMHPVFQFLAKDGSYKFVEVQLNNQLETPGINAIIVNMRDVTDSKRNREQLIKSENSLKRAQKIARLGNWEVSFKTETHSWSDEIFRIFGIPPNSLEPSLNNYLSFIHPDDKDSVLTIIQDSTSNFESASFSHRIITESGEVRIVENQQRFEFDDNGQAISVYGILHDITEIAKAKEALKEYNLNLEHAFDIAKIGSWKYDIISNTFSWNQSALDVIGFQKDKIPYTWEEYLKHIPESYHQIIQDSIANAHKKSLLDMEHELVINDNSKWIRVRSVIEYNENGIPVSVFGIIQDIDKIKINELKLEQTLNEKTALLMEVHHRVKNNLAIISGLLELQRMETDNEIIDEIFNQSINRISSIAMVHELLYKTDEFTSVDIRPYLDSLIPNIRNSMSSIHRNIDISVNVENYQININQAIPVGLLLNELLTNSFKYAFNDKINGKIEISLKHTPDNKLNFIYRDNGVGFKNGVNFEKPQNLGLTLVHTQLEQLDATYTFNTDNQFSLSVFFDAKSQEDLNSPLTKSGQKTL